MKISSAGRSLTNHQERLSQSKSLALLLILVLSVACGQIKGELDKAELGSDSGGGGGTVVVTPPNITLPAVTAVNYNKYSLIGACPIGASKVKMSLLTISKTMNCSNGLYQSTVDLSSVPNDSYVVQFESDNNQKFSGAVIVDKTAPTLTVNASSTVINSDNLNTFSFSGTCSEEGELVKMKIASLETSTTCLSNAYSFSVNFSPFTDGTISVMLTQNDEAGNLTLSSLSLIKDTVPPASVNLTGVPAGSTSAANLNISVGGTEVSHYKYKFGEFSTTNCTDLSTYSPEVAVGVPIASGLSSFGDGTQLKLCVLGRDANGNWMVAGNAYVSQFTRQISVEVAVSGLGSTAIPSSSTAMRTLTLSGLGVVAYKARTLKATSCASVDFSTVAETAIANPYYMGVGLGDGPYITCAIGKRSDGVWQASPTETSVLTIDTTGPAIAISTTAPNPTSTSPLSYTVQFNESITGFAATDISVTNGTLSDFLGSGTTYTFNVNPLTNGAVNVSIPAGGVLDLAGNSSQASNTVSRSFGSGFPTVTIASTATNYVSGVFQATVTFSAAVTGFDSGDITTTNATITGFTGSGTSYTVDVFPLIDGPVSIIVNADKAIDGGGLGNLQSNTLARIYDTLSPTVTLTSSASDPTKDTAINVNFQFSEDVTGFTASDVQVVNATMNGLTGSGSAYVLSISPIGNGAVQVYLPANMVQDQVGNWNTISSTLTRTYDVNQPTVTLSSTATSTTNLSAIPITATFSETVVGLTAGDVIVTNGSLTNFTGTGSTYTFDIVPSSNGAVNISIGSNSCVDLAGNNNLASTTLTRTYDNIAPIVTIIGPAEDSYINASTVTVFTVNGSCSENGGTVEITGAISSTATCSSGSWSKALNFSTAPQGNNTINVNLKDAAGNTATQVTRRYIKDSIAPSIAITAPVQNTVVNTGNMGGFGISGTCSENGGGITVSGDATGSTVCSSGTWSLALNFNLNPDGTLRVTAAQTDIAGNTTTTAQYAFVKNTSGSSLNWSISDITVEEFGMATFTISLDAPAPYNVTVDFAAEEDTAHNESLFPADADFVTATGSATILTGQTSVKVGIPILTDLLSEFDEDFWVRLTNASAGTLFKNLGRGTITKQSAFNSRNVMTKIKKLNAGRYHTCFVNNNGKVFCWGLGANYRLFQPNYGTNNYNFPAANITSGMTAVYAGANSSCWSASGKELYCQGIGEGYRNTSSSDSSWQGIAWDIVHADIGTTHSCWVFTNGSVGCWGNSNSFGQFGTGATTVPGSAPTISVTNANMVTVGESHSCALLNSGSIKCWGKNDKGQIGDASNTNRLAAVDTPIANAMYISSGSNHTCAVLLDATVKCWGFNGYGQLGDGTTTDANTPVTVTGITNAIMVSSGDFHTCAVLEDGTIKCWGRNNYGQLGNGSYADSPTPVSATSVSNISIVTAGGEHTCALKEDDSILCWGRNDSGQLGDGTYVTKNTAVDISNLSSANQISIGGWDTNGNYRGGCILMANGSAKCWGANNNNRWGSSTIGSYNLTVFPIPANVVELHVGYMNVCALINDGTVQCIGNNGYGQIGNGTTTEQLSFTSATGINNAVQIALAESNNEGTSVCAALADGTVKCWGRNTNGILGTNDTNQKNTPTTIAGLTNVTKISVGYYSACAIINDGTVKCWGAGAFVGDGTTTNRFTPVTISGLSNIIDISVGYQHACAAKSDGTVLCWGYNGYGQIGDGTTTHRNSPVPVSGLTGIIDVELGLNHSCARDPIGAVYCWGTNSYYEYGAPNNNSTTPVLVRGFPKATSLSAHARATCITSDFGPYCLGDSGLMVHMQSTIAQTPIPVLSHRETVRTTNYPKDEIHLTDVQYMEAGSKHSCALMTDLTVKCWGYNPEGQLGNGTFTNSTTSSVPVNGISGVTQLAVGDSHNCALISGAVYCWGLNSSGQLGDNTLTNRNVPVLANGLSSGVTSIFAGSYHTCAILSDGSIKCWGLNSNGQIGDGTTIMRKVPTSIVGVSGVVQGAADETHTCVVTGTGTASCWGYNFYGQLGNGTTANSSAPVTVNSMSNASKISVGKNHTCAIRSTGELSCWGYNSLYQLGDNTQTNRTSPITIFNSSNPVSEVALGFNNTCVKISSDQSIKCWGENIDDRAATRSPKLSFVQTPKDVVNMGSGIKSLSTGVSGKTCVVTSSNGVKCWGRSLVY